jgi:ABC-type multidrug transport system permease subunit
LIFILGGLGGCFPFGLEPLFRQEGVMGIVSRLTPHAHALEGYWLLMNDGAGVVDVLPQIVILAGMAAIFFVIAVWRFRFD